MDFIALNCNLGLALQQAINEVIKDAPERQKALNIYKDIFEETYNKHRDEFPEMQLSGKAITAKEYPRPDMRQYFEAIIHDPTLTVKERDSKSSTKIKFGKIEALEPKGIKNVRDPEKKEKRKSQHSLKDNPRKMMKKGNTNGHKSQSAARE